MLPSNGQELEEIGNRCSTREETASRSQQPPDAATQNMRFQPTPATSNDQKLGGTRGWCSARGETILESASRSQRPPHGDPEHTACQWFLPKIRLQV